MTEKLYYKDNMMKEFDARVLACDKLENGYTVLLDMTAFFPNEGGQYADSGYISDARVLDVREKDGAITHFTDRPLEVGEDIHATLDFDDRYEKMQCHSGEHIVSGLVHTLYGLNNVGFHLGREDMTLDFDGMLSREQLNELEELANEIVYRSIEIKCEFPSADILKTLEYRSKLELYENVRIVTIDGVDVCACCAPHVTHTGEIGVIKLLDSMSYKGGVRIHMLCGRRALRDYRIRYERNRDISMLTSAKQTDICAAVTRLLEDNGRLKGELAEFKRAVLREKMNGLRKTDENTIVFEELLGTELMREYAIAAARHTPGFCAVFCKRNDSEYNYIISANEGARRSSREVAQALADAFSARGGINALTASGKVCASEEALRKLLASL